MKLKELKEHLDNLLAFDDCEIVIVGPVGTEYKIQYLAIDQLSNEKPTFLIKLEVKDANS